MITQAIGNTGPDGESTPTTPALQGALNYAFGWASANTSHVTIVVLATDGEPTNCNPNDVDSCAGYAAQGLTVSPVIKTFVVGVGSDLSALNAIAMAGGTSSALLVDANAMAGQEFLDDLNMIRRDGRL